MKNIIIAVALTNKSHFRPMYASFPITDKALLDCLGSQSATEEVLNASLKFLGVPSNVPCVTGMYYELPDRPCQTFEQFLFNLEQRYRSARREMVQKTERKTIFQMINI